MKAVSPVPAKASSKPPNTSPAPTATARAERGAVVYQRHAALLAQYVSFSVGPGAWAIPARCSTCRVPTISTTSRIQAPPGCLYDPANPDGDVRKISPGPPAADAARAKATALPWRIKLRRALDGLLTATPVGLEIATAMVAVGFCLVGNRVGLALNATFVVLFALVWWRTVSPRAG